MNSDTLNIACDPLINTLLRIKRGEVDGAAAVEALESLKNSADVLIRSIEFDVTGASYGC